jgi:alkane 1-monooxygenase
MQQQVDGVAQRPWADRKRYLWMIALVMPTLTFWAIGLNAVTGWSIWLWLGPIVILGVVPVIDLLTGIDDSNPPDEVIRALEADRYYRWITYAFLPLQYAGFVLAMWVIARGDLSIVDKVGLAVTVGFIGGLGINTAHELGHKKESHERWLSKIALAQCAYGHFAVEHNRGHHVRVATPEDPASARMGESFYAYWPRTVLGSLRSAWDLERRRIGRHGRHPWRIGNDVVHALLMTVVLWSALLAWLGVGLLPYLVLQAVVGFTLLEAVNYLEHYGLLRQRVGADERSRYERVEPRHSWNSSHVTTNVLLYHLQRHSDHHAHPTRRYQALRDVGQAPVLPTGYAGMILIAFVPALWRRVMDPRVLAHYDGDARLANLHPRKRDRILAAHPGGPASTSTAVAASRVAAAPPASTSGTPSVAPSISEAMQCPVCNYRYEQRRGDAREGLAPGTPWSAVPDDWCCPDCGVRDKVDFVPALATG